MYTLVRKSCLCGLVVTLLCLGAVPRAEAQLTITSPSNMGTWSVGVVDGQLLSAINGSSQTYTWSIVGGALPPGLSLRTDLPSWVTPQNYPTVSAAIIGVATTPGTYSFVLQVTNNGLSVTQNATMTISSLLMKDFWQLPDAYTVPGQAYSHTLSAFRSVSGPVTATWSIPNWSNPWPAGLSLNSATGEIAGQATQRNSYNLTVGITHGGETVYRGITINVSDIRFTSSFSLPNATQSTSYIATVTAEGGSGTKTFAASGLPSGLSMSSSGVISGTTSSVGVFRVTITATDQNSVSYTRNHSLTVIGNPKLLPAIKPYDDALDDCTFGWPCSRGVLVYAGGTAPYNWSASGLPPGMSIRRGTTTGANPYYPAADGEIWGTPSQIGTYNVTITVTDAEGATATNTFPLKVSELAIMNNFVTWTRDVAATQVLRIIGGPKRPADFVAATDGTLNYTATALSGAAPAGVTFFASGPPRFSGTPVENVSTNMRVQYTSYDLNNNPGPQITGAYFFNIGNGASTLQINNNSNLGTFQVGSTSTITFTACCPSSGLTWSLHSGTLPAGLTLDSATGVLSGPLSGSPAIYNFVLQAQSGANIGRKAFTFYAASNSLTSSTTLPYGNVGVQYSTTITTSNGGSWTLDPFQYLPPGLTLNNGNIISGIPTQSGRFIFQMTNSSSGGVIKFTFSLSIYPGGQAPPIVWNPTSFGNNLGTLTRELPVPSGGTGSGYTYSYSPGATIIPGVRVQTGGPFPTNFSQSTTGALLGVTATPGVYNTSLRVTDSGGNFVDRPISVSVLGMLVMSQSPLPPAIKNTPYSYQLTQSGGIAPTWSVTGLPTGLTVNPSTGLISGSTSSVGAFNLNIGLSENGQFAGYGYSLQVNASDISFDLANSRVLPTGTQNVAYSPITFSAPNCGTGCTWSISSGSLPSGMSLNSTTGALSGTPTATNNNGFAITASGSNGASTERFSIQVMPSTPAVLQITNPGATQSLLIGSLQAIQLFGFGGLPPYNWSIDSGSLPAGLSLVSGDTLGGSQNPGFSYIAGRVSIAGTYTFTLKVTDSSPTPQTSTRVMTWGTKGLASSYSSLPPNGSQITNGVPFTTNNRLLVLGGSALAGTGNYTFENTSQLPYGLSLNTATGEVTGTPTEAGSTTTTFLATDTVTQESLSFNVTFNVSGSQIMNFGLGSNLGTASVGNAFSNDLLISGGIQPWTVTAVTPLPPGYSLLTGDSTFNSPPFTSQGVSPGAWFLNATPTTPGTYTFTLQVRDSAATPNIRQKTFIVTVVGFNVLGSTVLPDASVGEPYSYTAIATGVSGTPTFSLGSGSSLPPGLALNGNVISGTPTVASGTLTGGGYTFALELRDSAVPGLVRTLNYTLRVGGVRITDPQFLTTVGVVGTPFTHAFTAIGANVIWSATGIPAGYSFSSSGVLTNPDPAAGAFTITVTATPTNATPPVTRRFTFYVRAQNPTVLDYAYVLTKLADVTVNQQIFIGLGTISGGRPPYSWTVAPGASLPAGLALLTGAQLSSPIMSSFGVAPAALSGSVATPGTYTFDLILHDSLGAQARRTFTLKVSAIGIVSGTVRNGVANVGYGQRFTPYGGTAPYTFSMTPASLVRDTLPPGLNFTTSGVITGTPTSTGLYQFVLQVQDGGGNTFSRTVSYTITNANNWYINNVNPNDATLGTGRRSSMDLQLASTQGFPPTVSWNLLSGTPPPGVIVSDGPPWSDPGDGFIAGQPTATGTYTFTVRATDVGNVNNYADHTFKMRVAPMQMVDPPVEAAIAPDLPTAQAGVFYTTTLKAAGGTPPYTFILSPFNALPTGLTLSSSGVISGTPSFTGSTSFTPIISDAAGAVLNSNPLLLVVTPPGTPVPLSFIAADLPGGSVNVPFAFPLDVALRGGTPPFTWTVSAGSVLPPGMTLLPNSNGVSTYFAGVPTEADGDGFKFSLDAHDSSGQTVTIAYDFDVTASAVTPDTIRPGRVGVPYSAQITPTGGMAPYTLAVYPAFDMPPGLTLNSAGLLSGTPTTAGNFPIVLFLADSAGDENLFLYRIAIDNAAGEAPAVSLTPTPIQVFHTTGSPNPAPIQVAVGSTSTPFPYGLSIAGIPGATLSIGSGNAPDTVNLTLDLNGVAEGAYHGVLAVRSGAVNLVDQVPVTVTVAPPPPCTYSIAPSSGSVVANGGSGTFDLSTAANCSWTAVSNASWLTVDSLASGTGGGTIAFTASANPDITPRLGTITVQNQVFTLTQFSAQACSFAISPGTVSAPAGGGTAIVSVTASAPSCTWPASSSATLGLTPSTNVGSGTVTVTVPVNGVEPIGRQLTAAIAGLPFTVNQGGYNCTAALTPYEAGASAGGGSGSVNVTLTPGCSYDTIVGPSWVSITSGSSGSQSGALVYDVQPNSTTVPRQGTLTIGGQAFTITQEGVACSVTVDTSTLGSPYGPSAGGVGSIAVTANGSNCSWVASSTAQWASLSPTGGSGNGTVNVFVTSNAAATNPRTTDLTVAGQVISITQAGTACTYGLQSQGASVPAGGASGSVGVLTPSVCSWNAVSNAPSWLTAGKPSDTGSKPLPFSVLPNTSSGPRMGSLTVTGTSGNPAVLTFTVTQAGAACLFTLDSTGNSVGEGSVSSLTFGFHTAVSGCTAPTPTSYAGWLTVNNNSFDGTNGLVQYSVAANASGAPRSGTIQVGGKSFLVTQAGSACSYTLNAYGSAFGQSGGNATILAGASAGCTTTPPAGSSEPFIDVGTVSPPPPLFSIPFTVQPYISLNPAIRLGTVTFGGQIHTVKQTSW
jgi:hypothetical protein